MASNPSSSRGLRRSDVKDGRYTGVYLPQIHLDIIDNIAKENLTSRSAVVRKIVAEFMGFEVTNRK